jgi:hypothetical protein
MPGDAGHQGQEDHRRDDHLHQLDEAVAQRLQRFARPARNGRAVAPQHDRDQHLRIEMRIDRRAGRRTGERQEWRSGGPCILSRRGVAPAPCTGALLVHPSDRMIPVTRGQRNRDNMLENHTYPNLSLATACKYVRISAQDAAVMCEDSTQMKPIRRSLLAALRSLIAGGLTAWAGELGTRARQRRGRCHGGDAGGAHAFRIAQQRAPEVPPAAAGADRISRRRRGDSAAMRGARAALNRTLELLASRTDAADIYVIGPDGVTVAASNWRKPTSFVGQNYGFRPYFRDAMPADRPSCSRSARSAAGPASISRAGSIGAATPLGVVVVKVEFDAVESAWARTSGASFVTDANGVILVTSLPEWRFHTIGGGRSKVLEAAQRTLQYRRRPRRSRADRTRPSAVCGPDPAAGAPSGSASPPNRATRGRQTLSYRPARPPLAAARTQALLLGLAALLVLGGAAAVMSALQREAAPAARGTRRRWSAKSSAAPPSCATPTPS